MAMTLDEMLTALDGAIKEHPWWKPKARALYLHQDGVYGESAAPVRPGQEHYRADREMYAYTRAQAKRIRRMLRKTIRGAAAGR